METAPSLPWKPGSAVRIGAKYRHRVTGRELHLLTADLPANRIVLGELNGSAFCGWQWHGRSQDLSRDWEQIGAAL